MWTIILSPTRATTSRTSMAAPWRNRQYTIIWRLNWADLPKHDAMSATICCWIRHTFIRSGMTVNVPSGPGGSAMVADMAPAFSPATRAISLARAFGWELEGSVETGMLVARSSSMGKNLCCPGSASPSSGSASGWWGDMVPGCSLNC